MAASDEIIILKEVKYKDNDKILHCFSRKRGKIQIMAKNSRKTNSRNLSLTQTLSHISADLYRGKGMYSLSDGEVLNSFYSLKNDYEGFVYSSYVLEILNHVLQENENYSKIFDMTVKLFTMLSESVENIEVLVAAYEIKLVSILGYKPWLDSCISCGSEEGKYAFSIPEGGLVCGDCREKGKNYAYMNKGDVDCLKILLMSKFEDLGKVDVCSKKILKLAGLYFRYHIGKNNFKSLKLLGGNGNV
ncbi:DNA replication and repair protein RecO [Dethiosulfatibacter aminovorans DSM 17477]|uniref:DNA repair protein RecO n=1 Tax=Dethiosulfatibacter aminovorans DSM 17477 TaxID=1121476 RepID=A0A1M6DT67_9FIRM|nr:DNA repair protein RecO [Dethiosulfatibacter aminovorans]SHI76320.1 DNA replication and repair protein RecO [Dethiosulfatibacter aminovorans DSM 17477]